MPHSNAAQTSIGGNVASLHLTTGNRGKGAADADGPKVSAEHHSYIRNRARKFFKDHEGVISQGFVAKSMGLSGGALSAYMNENYRGDVDRVARKLERYLDTFELKRAFGNDTEFAETTAVNEIEEAIFLAEGTNGIARIVGVTGCGKSKTLLMHQLRSEAILIDARDGMTTPRSVLSQLWPLLFNKQELGRRNMADAQRAVIAALKTTPRTIMVDEFNYASPLAAETLRCIADRAQIALVLAGEIGRTYSGAFEGRIVAEVEIDAEFFTEDNIARVVASRLPVDVIREVMEILVEEARNSGGFRRVHRILQHAQSVAGKGRQITSGDVFAAVKRLRKAKGGAK